MDPAAGIFSPFHNEIEGKNGPMEHALEELVASANGIDTGSIPLDSARARGGKRLRDNEGDHDRTPCGACGLVYTSKEVPQGGVYLCSSCVVTHLEMSKTNSFRPNTLKCCPASVTEGGDGVVRCAGCYSWYHFACLEIRDPLLREYLSLSTTKWYCMDSACSEKVLQKQLKRKK
ncbi:hypothetical protein TRVL_02519 [Trypanosoma vivax]|uniref:Uncharacterized protein n=1 Tax=Trypanosoma vivax (strain Y486) TaxID=1055687 RepID=G0TSQ4_TRYVY|nr:hypothetical protein TRVL_02519 [Trypanosoma vivax]CCC46982.1 conserved hypothetical protein [Trypanosoma vivax Y486]